MISARRELFDEAIGPLAGALGPADLLSDIMDFDMTHYYDEQMGSPLYRRFAAFAKPIVPDALVEAKLATNAIEADFAARAAGDPPRPVNLDPGYVTPAKLVLASMKDFAHRIYLGRGVYAEVTLLRRGRRWQALPWTFPDFASGQYDGFLTAARQALTERGKERGR
jgi:hypothetical protein